MHDQEPFDLTSLNTYREWCKHITNSPQHFDAVTDIENCLHKLQTCSWPIICHSEKNSDDIGVLQQSGFLNCHYFYHGMVSRDWFRHWKYHPEARIKSLYQYRFLLYARDTTGSRTYRKTLLRLLHPWRNHVLCHDWTDRHPAVSSDYSAKICVKDAVLSAIHIVAETVFETSKIHLTEKIFKSMVMRQPFLLLAGAGALEYLRGYGFRTFDTVWDESYDQDRDADSRMAKVVAIIEKIMTYSDREFQDLVRQCDHIVEHNHRHFFSTDFENIMLQELGTNMQECLDQQHRLKVADPGGSLFHTLGNYHRRNVFIHPKIIQRTKNVVNFLREHRPQQFECIQSRYRWVSDYAG